MQTDIFQSQHNRKWLIGSGIALLLLMFIFGIFYLPYAVDWRFHIRPAVLALLRGETPYQVPGFYVAPWTAIPLIPYALLPEEVGRSALTVTALLVLGYTGMKLGAKPFALGFLLLSPPVVQVLFYGNIDWMVALGFVLPPQIGLFFVSMKPQIGWVVALFWLAEAWHSGGWRQVLKTFAPVAILTLLSFAIFGLWPLRFQTVFTAWETNKHMNLSLWPFSIPVGLLLTLLALRRRRIEFAMGASPCLAPHVLLHSWIGAFLAVIRHQGIFIALVIGAWGFLILNDIFHFLQ